jgi:hypothetical protein
MDHFAGSDQGLRNIVRDPVVQLAMASDGVTEDEMLQVLRRARWALTMRDEAGPRQRLYVVPSAQPGWDQDET